MTREPKPCGTSAAYERHVRRREEVDQACRDAHAAYVAERRALGNPGRELQPHGTYGAYQRHLRASEVPCEECRQACNEKSQKEQRRRRQRLREEGVLPPINLRPCGTEPAHRRHRRRGEDPCEPCRAAHAAHIAAIRLLLEKKPATAPREATP